MLPVESLEQTTNPWVWGTRAGKWTYRLGLSGHVPMFSGTYLLPTRRLQNLILLLDRLALSEVTLNFYPASSRVRRLNE